MTKNQTIEKSSSPSFLQAVTPLMKEYTSKLQLIGKKLRAFLEQIYAEKDARIDKVKEHDAPSERMWREKGFYFQSLYKQQCSQMRNLVPPTKKLAQHVSQMISHAGLTDLEKIELNLRLAELESAISMAEEMLGLPQPQLKF